MIPMGTVVTVCMLLTVLFANRFPRGAINAVAPRWLLRCIGILAVLAGLWNMLWYGMRHIGEFWGYMALGSGLVMLLLSLLLLLKPGAHPAMLNLLRPVLVVLLLCFASYYAWTIYHL